MFLEKAYRRRDEATGSVAGRHGEAGGGEGERSDVHRFRRDG